MISGSWDPALPGIGAGGSLLGILSLSLPLSLPLPLPGPLAKSKTKQNKNKIKSLFLSESRRFFGNLHVNHFYEKINSKFKYVTSNECSQLICHLEAIQLCRFR